MRTSALLNISHKYCQEIFSWDICSRVYRYKKKCKNRKIRNFYFFLRKIFDFCNCFCLQWMYGCQLYFVKCNLRLKFKALCSNVPPSNPRYDGGSNKGTNGQGIACLVDCLSQFLQLLVEFVFVSFMYLSWQIQKVQVWQTQQGNIPGTLHCTI